jgi:Copper type II ascorbate-dependent monooxygenase, C-terminal domain
MKRIRHHATIVATAVLFVVATMGALLSTAPAGAKTAAASPKSIHMVFKTTAAFTPHPPNGATDLYHCSVINPKLAQDMMVTSTSFHPGTKEVHHAILYRVAPQDAAQAEAMNDGGKGWTCFGEPSVSSDSIGEFSGMPWLCGWSPGHGADTLPAGLGVPLPKGSLFIMQIHYNTLAGDKPDRSWISLTATPTAGSDLKPVTIQQLPAPPDIPCPANVSGPLCDRGASLADLGQRFGQAAVLTVFGLEKICGRNPVNPPAGNSTSCNWPVRQDEVIQRITPHMHLLGKSMTITLDPGTPQARTILNVNNYNFDSQVAYNINPPVHVGSGDTIGVSCTWDPTLRQFNPQTKHLPPRFITWGDGSSDEMCLAVMTTTAN